MRSLEGSISLSKMSVINKQYIQAINTIRYWTIIYSTICRLNPRGAFGPIFTWQQEPWCKLSMILYKAVHVQLVDHIPGQYWLICTSYSPNYYNNLSHIITSLAGTNKHTSLNKLNMVCLPTEVTFWSSSFTMFA